MLQKLLSSGTYRSYNIYLAKGTSVNASIVLGYIFYLMEYHNSYEVFNSNKRMQKYTALSKKEVENAVSVLVKAGLIKKSIKGSPPVSFFKFDNECHHNLNHLLLTEVSKKDCDNIDNQEHIKQNKEAPHYQSPDNEQFPLSGQSISPFGADDFPQVDNKEYINKEYKETINKIKLHSPLEFSDENQGGDLDSSFQDTGIEIQDEQPTEPKKTKPVKLPHEKYRLTEAQYKTLQSYHKGFCETIDLHAKVQYSRDFKFMVSIFKKLNKDIKMLKMLYSYFRTYRDFNKAYVLEIRSLASLDKKLESLLAEAIRETKERIMKTNSLILHEIPEKKIIIKYVGETVNAKDFKFIKEKGDEGHETILIDFGFTAEEAGYIPYVKPQTNYPL